MKKIILLGYMGSGKSTIAQLLSEVIGIPHLDLDQMIESKTNLSIATLFKEKGEIYFRKLEHEIFQELMCKPDPMVLSLGGGTPCYANNHIMLNGVQTVSFYLKASINTLYERLIIDKKNRPLLAEQGEVELKEFIAKHLFDRSFYYHQSKHTVVVDAKSPDSIVREIQKILA
jgi:shikimate kinase